MNTFKCSGQGGMGKSGDQSLDFMQNKTLPQSNTNCVEVYLFEVFEKKKYTYIGQVKLIGEPYQYIQLFRSSSYSMVI